ncbi:MAG: GNAT family N-acetyltransferase [Dehalococcoidia bacterium]|nr:GNAT family N-acetyltransferase [Dehalococcoidia bacterium]
MPLAPPVLTVHATTRLRPWRAEDARDLSGVIEASREHVAEWLTWAEDYTLERADGFIRRALASYVDGSGLEMCLEIDGAIAGGCGLVRIDRDHFEAEVGYWLGLPYTKRGHMTRAVAALTDHVMDKMAFHRVQIRALAGNAPSRAIPERLGFRQEGLFVADRWHRGEWHDTAFYAITEQEWRTRRG